MTAVRHGLRTSSPRLPYGVRAPINAEAEGKVPPPPYCQAFGQSRRHRLPAGGLCFRSLVPVAHFASLKRALGDLDRATAWLRVFAMVNVAPGFNETPLVTNGCSDLILELDGPEAGSHARSSIGMAIRLDPPVNCEAEVEIRAGDVGGHDHGRRGITPLAAEVGDLTPRQHRFAGPQDGPAPNRAGASCRRRKAAAPLQRPRPVLNRARPLLQPSRFHHRGRGR